MWQVLYRNSLIKKKYRCKSYASKEICVWKESGRKKLQYKTHFYMDLGWRDKVCRRFWRQSMKESSYFIDNDFYFNGFLHPHVERCILNEFRKVFRIFSKALSLFPVIDFRPDNVHCNDWQTD